MGKRNKIRYTSTEKIKRRITITGTVFLQYEDSDIDIAAAEKGDFLLLPQNDALQTNKQGDYRSRGHAGYFRAEIFDGKFFKPVQFNSICKNREQYFTKSEHPLDTFKLCGEILIKLAGRQLIQTYRDHYTLAEDVVEKEEGASNKEAPQ